MADDEFDPRRPFDPSEFVYNPDHWTGHDVEDMIVHVLTNRSHWVTFRFYVEILTRVLQAKFGRETTQADVELLWLRMHQAYGWQTRPLESADWDRPVSEGAEEKGGNSFFQQIRGRRPPETPDSQLLPDYEDQLEDDPKTVVATTTTNPTPTTGPPAPTALDNPVVFTAATNPTPTMATSTAALKKKGKAKERDVAGVKAIETKTPAERQREAQTWRRGQTFAAARKTDQQRDHTMGVGQEALTQQLAANAAQQKKAQWTAAPTPRDLPAWMVSPHVGEQRWGQKASYHFRGVGENDTGRLLSKRGDTYNTPTYRREFEPPAFGPANRTQYIDTRGADGDGRDDSLPWKRKPNEGAYTGAPRPSYPRMFRPFGSNTRQRVVGDRSGITHMHHTGYAKGIVESVPSQPLLPSHSTLGQSGAASVNHGIAALRAGPSHYLFTHR